MKFPGFEKVVPLCVKAHQAMCPMAFTLGWDVALTTKGIKLIEVNYCSPVIQYFAPRDLHEMTEHSKPGHLDWILHEKLALIGSKVGDLASYYSTLVSALLT